MEIESNVVELFGERKPGDASREARGSSKEKWLSALEKESFGITDDSLRDQTGAQSRGGHKSGVDGSGQQGYASVSPDTVYHEKQGIPKHQLSNPARMSVQLPVGFNRALPNQIPQAMPGQTPSDTAKTVSSNPARPGITMSSPGLSQRYEALLNQTRFMDVNIQLTQSRDGMTLWIRDFKNKYSNEVFHWAQSLETLLGEKGQSISRIMLNGKNLSTIDEIIGGQHGN
jgi:hypothetical protein